MTCPLLPWLPDGAPSISNESVGGQDRWMAHTDRTDGTFRHSILLWTWLTLFRSCFLFFIYEVGKFLGLGEEIGVTSNRPERRSLLCCRCFNELTLERTFCIQFLPAKFFTFRCKAFPARYLWSYVCLHSSGFGCWLHSAFPDFYTTFVLFLVIYRRTELCF